MRARDLAVPVAGGVLLAGAAFLALMPAETPTPPPPPPVPVETEPLGPVRTVMIAPGGAPTVEAAQSIVIPPTVEPRPSAPVPVVQPLADLQDPDATDSERAQAVERLLASGAGPAEKVRALSEALAAATDYETRVSLLRAIGDVGGDDAVLALTRQVGVDDVEEAGPEWVDAVARAAFAPERRLSATVRDEAVSAMMGALGSLDPVVRDRAAGVLGTVGAEDPAIRERLASQRASGHAGHAATIALGRTGDQRAVDRLVEIARGVCSHDCRAAALDALGGLGAFQALSGLISNPPDAPIPLDRVFRAIGRTRQAEAYAYLAAAVREGRFAREAASGLAAAKTPEATAMLVSLLDLPLPDSTVGAIIEVIPGLPGASAARPAFERIAAMDGPAAQKARWALDLIGESKDIGEAEGR